MDRQFCVYILASVTRVLYLGVTSDLERRVWQHKTKAMEGFSSQYNVSRLVYVEPYDRIDDAIARERQLKRWARAKKVLLIEKENPEWADLSYKLFGWDPVEVGSAASLRRGESAS
ncbi:MAG TPA: GIY-YIG nuclease family protein [Thermomicrobiales bacterium]|nr:GIY-YIG nuclease family protein [Thermomicrobiales bacterium]